LVLRVDRLLLLIEHYGVAYDGPTADEERVAEADAVMRSALAWAKSEEVIRAVALVGSWSRGAARMDSDLDLIVLCTEASAFWSRRAGMASSAPSK